MNKAGDIILKRAFRQIQSRKILKGILFAIAASLLVMSAANYFLSSSWFYLIPLFLVCAPIFIYRSNVFDLRLRDMARLLNERHPELEESAELWLKDPESLSILEKLQLQKINQLDAGRIGSIDQKGSFTPAISFLFIAALIAVSFSFLPDAAVNAKADSKVKESASPVRERVLPSVNKLRLTIKSPAYTKLPDRVQSQFAATFPKGSSLVWEISTSADVSQVIMILNNSQKISFERDGETGTRWRMARILNASGFYQISVNGKLSDLYPLIANPDEPPVIRVTSPGKHTVIDFGEARKVLLKLSIKDDYGLTQALVEATVSSGSGEGVKFKEYTMPVNRFLSGAKSHEASKILDLSRLGMVPGDELYFYISARDSRQQQSRSNIYIVSLPDTTELMSLEGLIGGVNLVPEYFRSQRQIIIDTEKLIETQSSISADEFNKRSNNLGLDQKMLRLRYGKFLGEESETEIGRDSEHAGEDGHDEAAAGNAESIMDSYAHKHDIAEDATFFEPELKAQLKAVLTEMWKSELKLRTHLPTQALPSEYKALRLLKDLQQKPRVYVAKTSFKPPPLKVDKRLSGELDKIQDPVRATEPEAADERLQSLRSALASVEKLKSKRALNNADLRSLNLAGNILAKEASASPERYLKALAILNRVLRNNTQNQASLSIVQRAIEGLIVQARNPVKGSKHLDELSERYFQNLERMLR